MNTTVGLATATRMVATNTTTVDTVVVPAGGWGTRVLPLTVVVPKPDLPVFKKPAVQLIVEEAVAAGITRVVFVTTANQRGLIEDHFNPSGELLSELKRKGKLALVEDLLRLREQVEIKVVNQGEAKGLGHAVLGAKKEVGKRPFAIRLPDDLIDPRTPILPRMLVAYERYQGSILALFKVPQEQVSSFGIVAGAWLDEKSGLYRVDGAIEKPEPNKAPSDLAIAGCYVCDPEIFDLLAKTGPGKGGEIQLTDALMREAQAGRCHGVLLDGTRYDTGTPMGLLTSSNAYAFMDAESAPELVAWFFKAIKEDPALMEMALPHLRNLR